MISVLTLTYQRRELLEEAVESFLRQDFSGESEMLIVNDCDAVEYVLPHPKIRIINRRERFPSIGQKLRFGFGECTYDHIYRLDDDDLLAPWALRHTWEDILAHPAHEIYRSDGHYFLEHNRFKGISSSVNNGNIYTKRYLSRIEIPECSFGEDQAMTFGFDADIYVSQRAQKTMLYRWGMSTYHVSGMGDVGNEAVRRWTDDIVAQTNGQDMGMETAVYVLRPHFREEYYQQIPDI